MRVHGEASSSWSTKHKVPAPAPAAGQQAAADACPTPTLKHFLKDLFVYLPIHYLIYLRERERQRGHGWTERNLPPAALLPR